MPNLYQTPDSDVVVLSDDGNVEAVSNPWLSMFFSPRKTVRYISRVKPYYGFFILIILNGLIGNWDLLYNEQLFQFELGARIAIWIFGGVFGGFIGVYLLGWWIKIFTQAFGGIASYQDVRVAMVWSYVVYLPMIPMLAVFVYYWGLDTSIGEDFYLQLFQNPPALFMFFALSFFTLAFWSLILLCNGIAEVSGYTSAWKAFGVLLLAGLAAFIIIAILAIIVGVIVAAAM